MEKSNRKELALRTKLTSDQVSELEDRIRSREPEPAYEYLWDTLSFCLDSQSEVHRRSKVLISLPIETTAPLICLAVLSAVNDKTEVWRSAQKHIGESEPGLGFLAWRSILVFRKDEEQASAWFHVVEQSARLGHLPSKRIILGEKFRKARLIERTAIRFRLAFNALQQGIIERRDMKDRRVAEYFLD